jgi:hypothetical protein
MSANKIFNTILNKIRIRLKLILTGYYQKIILPIRKCWLSKKVVHRSQNGILAIEINSDWLGLGARIVQTIELLMYADEKKILPEIRYGYKERKKPKDYFNELFENTSTIASNKNRDTLYTKINTINELNLEKNYNELLSIQSANQLFHKYLKIKESIIAEVDNFTKLNFEGHLVLGLHYRGTDKSNEAPQVSLSFVFETIQKILSSREVSYTRLFISSDEVGCIEYFKKNKLPIEIIWRNDIYRSNDSKQFHRNSANDISVINREALINCLLLAKCKFLIKSSSLLSDCCKIFNPELEMLILNKPYRSDLTWWPTTELNSKYFIGNA